MIQLQTGDRILVNSDSKLSKLIQFFMKKWAKKKGLNAEFTYSHAGTIVMLTGFTYVAESVENGFRLRQLDRHYLHNPSITGILFVRPKQWYTEEEELNIEAYALYLQEVNNFYQYWGLLQWAILVTTGINLFGKGNKFSNYCYEGAYRIAKHVRPADFPKNPEIVTCYDLYDPERDEIVYRNKQTK